jgi:inorganic pyrophosphatase
MTNTPFHRWRPHPWHGLKPGRQPPEWIYAFIEITPFDSVKYEIDKETGYLWVDRPQHTSSVPPTLYGFIPRTFCGERVGALEDEGCVGDGDPLDVCVVSERLIEHSEVILAVRVVGGIRTVDNGRSDDKIVAVLEKDNFWGDVQDISELPGGLIERLRHYFSTYKLLPGQDPPLIVKQTYGRETALQVVEAALEDYEDMYGQYRDLENEVNVEG